MILALGCTHKRPTSAPWPFRSVALEKCYLKLMACYVVYKMMFIHTGYICWVRTFSDILLFQINFWLVKRTAAIELNRKDSKDNVFTVLHSTRLYALILSQLIMLISNPKPHLTCHIITSTPIRRFQINSQQIPPQDKLTVTKMDSCPDQDIIFIISCLDKIVLMKFKKKNHESHPIGKK